ncbi:MAG: arsenate reductase (glutaredoxin) [Gammaproteobacteria bacterium]|nr:arsenate reductase (glutaredoxin) [Gammaproteobacteria bacterium]MBT8110245.1 arsenate reductase (glutaredoxin) [Gammaproteobacteria bacterium]NND48165.1 arsenate reductase (glutaredoxin) [Woeseiaceae bacterium]NNL44948.1 arsenate reductase (glutaredoxin) [Woeseiaceae bacterium]
MSLTIYHNPRCSKSRKTLEIIRSAGIVPTVVLYLQDPPDAAGIGAMAARLGMPVVELLRRGESAVKDATDLPAMGDDDALAAWIAAHPIALQRPIVVDAQSGRAIIGRPPEKVRELLP